MLGQLLFCALMPSNQSRRLDIAPLSLLQYDAIAIAILIGMASCFPIWIERRDLLEPSSQHAVTHCFPFRDNRHVEDGQVFNSRRGKHRMSAAMSELKVIAGSNKAKHHAVEAFVIFESSDDAETQPAAVHVCSARKIANWPCDTQVALRHDSSSCIRTDTSASLVPDPRAVARRAKVHPRDRPRMQYEVPKAASRALAVAARRTVSPALEY